MSIFGPPDIDRLKEKGKIATLQRLLFNTESAKIAEDAVQALLALWKIGDQRAVDALIKALDACIQADRVGINYTKRYGAIPLDSVAGALGNVADQRAVDALIKALRNAKSPEAVIDLLWALKLSKNMDDPVRQCPDGKGMHLSNCEVEGKGLRDICLKCDAYYKRNALEPLIDVLENIEKIAWKNQWIECLPSGTIVRKEKVLKVVERFAKVLKYFFDQRAVKPLKVLYEKENNIFRDSYDCKREILNALQKIDRKNYPTPAFTIGPAMNRRSRCEICGKETDEEKIVYVPFGKINDSLLNSYLKECIQEEDMDPEGRLRWPLCPSCVAKYRIK